MTGKYFLPILTDELVDECVTLFQKHREYLASDSLTDIFGVKVYFDRKPTKEHPSEIVFIMSRMKLNTTKLC